jgi:hypothetical protein
MTTLTPTPKQQIFGTDGTPLVGGKIYTYSAGTTTPLATYTDAGGLTANTNPIILDSLGQASIWLSTSTSYKFSVYTSANVLLYTVDSIAAPVDYLTFASPPPIGNTTPNTGAFTTLTATTGTITTVNATTATVSGVTTTGTLTFSGGGSMTKPSEVGIQSISASAASSALTISASALSLDFRSTTLTSGTVTTVSGTPANLVVPSTATLGTVSAVQSRLIVLALNNAGTIELAVVNIAGGNDLTETGLISTTAIAAASNSASTVYSTTARTSVAYRVIGYIESTQATAGTWATTPSTIQGCGGQALTAMSSLGYGQVWSNPTRVAGTTYYNTSGKPRFVVAIIQPTGGSGSAATWTVAGVTISGASATSVPTGLYIPMPIIVPPGQSYLFTTTTGQLGAWSELG